jgi:hypothetical protein
MGLKRLTTLAFDVTAVCSPVDFSELSLFPVFSLYPSRGYREDSFAG